MLPLTRALDEWRVGDLVRLLAGAPEWSLD